MEEIVHILLRLLWFSRHDFCNHSRFHHKMTIFTHGSKLYAIPAESEIKIDKFIIKPVPASGYLVSAICIFFNAHVVKLFREGGFTYNYGM